MITISSTATAANSMETIDVLVENFRREPTPERFEPLILSNIDKIRRIIYRVVLCPEDTEDLVQETFIRAYEKIDSFKGEASFSTWVCRIGINLALSFLRRSGKRNTLALTQDLPDIQDCSPQRNQETDQELKRIHEAIAQLPAKYRAVIVLSVVEEMETHQIAAILNCAHATVYWRMHRARKMLAARLEVKP